MDIIISNPPYFFSNVMDNSNGFAPDSALDGGTDGLLYYEAILSRASHCLSDSGCVVLQVQQINLERVLALVTRYLPGAYYHPLLCKSGKPNALVIGSEKLVGSIAATNQSLVANRKQRLV